MPSDWENPDNSFAWERGGWSRLIGGLIELLNSIPDIRVLRVGDQTLRDRELSSQNFDVSIEIKVNERRLILEAVIRRNVFPRDLQNLIGGQLTRFPYESRSDFVPFVISDRLSSGARDLLRDASCGYFDASGSLYIPAPGAFVFIDKRERTHYLQESGSKSLFSGKSARVLHVLLNRFDSWHGATEIAEHCSLAPSTVSRALVALEQRDLVETRGIGPTKERRVKNAAALLDEWVNALPRQTHAALERYFVPGLTLNRPSGLVRAITSLESYGLVLAVTHEAASQLYAPFLSAISTIRCRVARTRNLSAAMAAIEATPVDSGFNLGLLEVESDQDLPFRERIDGVPLANPVQVYLDLIHAEGRAKEAAAHLRKEKIGF